MKNYVHSAIWRQNYFRYIVWNEKIVQSSRTVTDKYYCHTIGKQMSYYFWLRHFKPHVWIADAEWSFHPFLNIRCCWWEEKTCNVYQWKNCKNYSEKRLFNFKQVCCRLSLLDKCKYYAGSRVYDYWEAAHKAHSRSSCYQLPCMHAAVQNIAVVI